MCPKGTCVSVKLDDGTEVWTMTTSEAWLVGSHPIVKLESTAEHRFSGGYSLLRVTPSDE